MAELWDDRRPARHPGAEGRPRGLPRRAAVGAGAGLLSYRYIGRIHSSMNLGPEDNTVPHPPRHAQRGRRHHGGAARHLLPGGLPGRPGRRAQSGDRLGADPRSRASTSRRSRSATPGSIHQGRTMGYGRCLIVDADNRDRVIAFIDGQGATIGDAARGSRADGRRGCKHRHRGLAGPAAAVAGLRGVARRGDGHWVLPELTVEFASPDAALHIGPQHVVLETAAIDLAAQTLAGTRRLQRAELARDVPRPRQGRPVPGRRYGLSAPRAAWSASACSCTTRATATVPSPRARRCWPRRAELVPPAAEDLRVRVRPDRSR